VLGRELQIAVPIGGERRSLKVKIPRGIGDGQTMRLRGQGARSPNGGPAGDLMLEIKIREGGRYRRLGNDLEVRESITVGQAYRGTTLPVETPWGRVNMTVPAGTQGGQKLRVKGHGVRAKGANGDLYVQLSIKLPTSRETEVEEAIEKLEQMY
jgi:DnaJ-class molecular chaperone